MHSISDLTTFCRKTTGDVPPKLVGASTTAVGSKMYLFGGRLVTERRMVSDLYVFDMDTFVWERLAPLAGEDIPGARYFHSAEAWNNHLVVFGGMGINPETNNPEDLCILNDIRFFDISARRWLPSNSPYGLVSNSASDPLIPKARYAHLSSVTGDRLFVIGGQDLSNVWLDDVYAYDLKSKTWVMRRDYPRHCGTYRSVAVASNLRVRLPQEELRGKASTLGPPGSRFKADKVSQPPENFTPPESLVHLPYSATPSDDYPSEIVLYSNYNFTDVKRELGVFSPLPGNDVAITDRSNSMTGSSFPPGLRFPTGAVLGTHLIIAGTYLAHTYQSFSVWALDLQNLTWSRIDPGSALSTGSWFRGCLHTESNKFLIFGNRHGNLVEDYNRRLLSWDHVACIDLEAFGIYQPPKLMLEIPKQELGLAALEEGVLADFEIVCDDGRKIKCSRKCLEDRWPWFKEERRKFTLSAQRAADTLPLSPQHIPPPQLPGNVEKDESRPDPRLTPRSFNLSEPYPVTLALLQYFYTLSLLTPLQHAPAVLSQLLVLSSTYKLSHLETLVKHAMHRALSNSTSVGVYEVATLCSCRSLQIRALKTVMSYSQKRPQQARVRSDRDPGGGTGGTSGGGAGRGGHNPGGDMPSAARPRGMSDAHARGGPPGPSASNMGRGYVLGNRARFSSDAVLVHLAQEKLALKELPAARPPPKHPPPPPLSLQKRPAGHQRSTSTVSVSTEKELCAVAELMSPSVLDTRYDPEDLTQDVPTGIEDSDSDVDTPLPREHDHGRALSVRLSTALRQFSPPSPTARSPSPRRMSVSSVGSDYDEFGGGAHVAAAVYHNFHLPPSHELRIYTTSDSDLPSLSTRASVISSTNSLPATPNRMSVSSWRPASPSPSNMEQLEAIPEKTLEDEDLQSSMLSFGSDEEVSFTFAPVRPSVRGTTYEIDAVPFVMGSGPDDSFMDSLMEEDEDDFPKPSRAPSIMEELRIEPPPPLTQIRPRRPSTAQSFSSDATSPSPRTPSFSIHRNVPTPKSLTRFLSGSKSEKTPSFQERLAVNETASDVKARKAEEKMRKKQEAKAKTERLAAELKARAAERSEQDRASLRGKGKKEAVMYGGMVWG